MDSIPPTSFSNRRCPITVTILVVLAVMSLLYSPAKVLAVVFLLLVIYSNPLPSLLTLAVLSTIYYYTRK